MGRLEQRPLAELVHGELLAEVMNGSCAAGSKLSEEGICRKFGVSRTPAREALMMLCRDGIVDRIPRRGCFVKAFDPEELAELFECRRLVECLALDLGFDQIPKPAVAALEKRLAGKAGGDRKKSLEVDDELHALIVKSCPNRCLREIAGQLLRRTFPYRLWRTNETRSVSGISEERRRILSAIRRADKAAALRLLGEHIEQGRRMVEKLGR